MKKKIFVLLTLVAAMAMFFVGCGKKEEGTTADGKKVLRVGMECMNAPYNWTQTDDSNGAVKIAGTDQYVNGYDVMIAKKIAEENGMELEVYKIEWDGLIMAVQSDKIDAIVAGMSATEERKESVDFSETYYDAKHVVVVRKDSAYAGATSLDDLKGCSATSQQGTTLYESAGQIPDVDLQEALPDISSVIVAVDSGRTDAVVVEKPMAVAAVATNSDLVMIEFEEGKGFNVDAGVTNIAVATKKGDSEIMDACNKTISAISDEEKDELMEKAISIQPASE
ncbi:MAG: transporter substrate-binding domain-containing protein [Lachnospiraceae bacterium]